MSPAATPAPVGGGGGMPQQMAGLSSGGAPTNKPASSSAKAGGSAKATVSSSTTTKKAPKRKRTTTGTTKKKSTKSKSGSSASTPKESGSSIWNAARLAQAELAQQRARDVAIQQDPLWYRAEESLQAVLVAAASSGQKYGNNSYISMTSPPGLTSGGLSTSINQISTTAQHSAAMKEIASVLPGQIELVDNALRNNKLSRIDVTPQAFACLLEQARRYALEIIADAQDYAYSANRHEVTSKDLLLSAELRGPSITLENNLSINPTVSTSTSSASSTITNSAVTLAQQPKLSIIASKLNRIPLPPIPASNYSGVVLPSKEHLLTSRTFDIVSGAKTSSKMIVPPPAAPSATKSRKDRSSSSYGAKKGQQIQINIKSQTNSNKATTSKTKVAATDAATTGATTLPSSTNSIKQLPQNTTASSAVPTVTAPGLTSISTLNPSAPPFQAPQNLPQQQQQQQQQQQVQIPNASTTAAPGTGALAASSAALNPK